MPFFTPPGSAIPQQIDPGTFTVQQEGSIVGYVWSDVENEYWVLRTSSPVFTWPSGPVGTTTSCSYEYLEDATYSSLEEFVAWVESTCGWSASEFETVDCRCTVQQGV